MSTSLDEHFLPGVSFTVDGETLPSREVAWAMVASCGCISGLHMMTVDTVTEDAAWKAMSGNAAMIKQDRARGFSIRMVKCRDISFDDCPHTPRWGYMPTPVPAGYSWASTHQCRVRHLVPLIAEDDEDSDREWAEDDGKWGDQVGALCGKANTDKRLWSRKWHHLDGKAECTACVRAAGERVLL